VGEGLQESEMSYNDSHDFAEDLRIASEGSPANDAGSSGFRRRLVLPVFYGLLLSKSGLPVRLCDDKETSGLLA